MHQGLENFPSSEIVKEFVTSSGQFPVVFKNQISSWKVPWTGSSLKEKYGETSLDFRLVPKSKSTVFFEGQADFVEATISDFISWQTDDMIQENNPFKQFDKKKFWAYSSYNYMNTIFPQDSEILKAVDWSRFGFNDLSGKDSSFWLGSESAYTPCHVDSYGCNLVAQILGRKKWILFPPDDTECLYPTRIPYEESSIFSSVNILNPDFITHPLFKNSHPHVVILEPGDVLFVPKKWWHFVMNLDNISESINTWIPLDSDCHNRFEESVTRLLMSSLISYCEPEGESWLNPKEELVSSEDSLNYISRSLTEVKEKNISPNEVNEDPPPKMRKLSKETVHRFRLHENNVCSFDNVKQINAIPFSTWMTEENFTSTDILPQKDATLKKIIDAVVHPDVISLISHLIRK